MPHASSCCRALTASFVVDSQISRLDENVESYLNLWDNCSNRETIFRMALVLQMNKRDLTEVFLVTIYGVVESNQVTGIRSVGAHRHGVFETLKAVCNRLCAHGSAVGASGRASESSGAKGADGLIHPPARSSPSVGRRSRTRL